MKLFICDGYWFDNGSVFSGMVVADGSWNGLEDAIDERIFYYTDGFPVVGDHGEFIITKAEEYGYVEC